MQAAKGRGAAHGLHQKGHVPAFHIHTHGAGTQESAHFQRYAHLLLDFGDMNEVSLQGSYRYVG